MKVFKNSTSQSNDYSEVKTVKAMEVINSHAGKAYVYNIYVKKDKDMAQKYLSFVNSNPHINYIKWDNEKKRFTA